ncbi:hypothetical protein OSTOST_01217 [Ostertagia ostertagi]
MSSERVKEGHYNGKDGCTVADADEKKIDDKLRRIAWVGLGEQKDGLATKKFDKEALKEGFFFVTGDWDPISILRSFDDISIDALMHREEGAQNEDKTKDS